MGWSNRWVWLNWKDVVSYTICKRKEVKIRVVVVDVTLTYILVLVKVEIVSRTPSSNIGASASLAWPFYDHSWSCLTHHAGKFSVGNFLCMDHVIHIDMHMASTCSQNTVSIACLQCYSCHFSVCTCTVTPSFTLALFMLQGVLSWLPCCLVSRIDITFGVHWAPQNIPLKVIILQSWWASCQSGFGQSCCIVDLCQHSCSTTKICVGFILWFMLSWHPLNTHPGGSILVI